MDTEAIWYVKSDRSRLLTNTMRMMDMKQVLQRSLISNSAYLSTAGLRVHAQEACAKDKQQTNLVPVPKPEVDNKGDGQEKYQKIGDDVGVRIPDLDRQAEALPLDCLVLDSRERDAVDEGRDDDPNAGQSDDDEDDIVGDAGPTHQEESPVEQQDGDLGTREAGGVQKQRVPRFLGAGGASSVGSCGPV